MDRERFSMLLLEPGEIYFEDYSVIWLSYDPSLKKVEENCNGLLKLCSKSLVFESQSGVKPLIKIQYKECSCIGEWERSMAVKGNIISVKCSQYIEMLEGNIIAPYQFKAGDREFLFLLHYASITDTLQQMNQLKRASTLHACEQNSMIATISHSRYSRMRFDPLWLDDIYDTILLEIKADRITPLVQNPGKVLLTSKTLYFQPCNNIDPYPVLRLNINKIQRIFRRRFLLRQVGLEMYNESESELPHIYLAMKSQEDRDKLYSLLLEQPSLQLYNMEQNQMTMQWQNGVISNYDYIMYLNSLADRTKTDLTQYPVFPWIINDYTSPTINLEEPTIYRDLSKPVGALNPERLHRLRQRYEEMAPPKFLYGSHYSAPGLVLFYLVRKYPHYMLCLQNGRFDHPDRMFNVMADVFRNCLNNMSDFKELIPEFYDIEGKGDFLENEYGINFGYRHDGSKVDNVQLPPWAKSPQHFIETLRKALETDIVSQNLHNWIDLIFGYKQRGIEAEKSDNVFFHLCYEGTVNLDDIADMNEKHALEVQIMEFGQIPKQIFTKPHARRILQCIQRPLSENRLSSKEICNDETKRNVKSIREWFAFHSHREGVSSVLVSDDGKKIISTGKDALLKVYCIDSKKQTRSISIGTMALSSCIQMNDTTLIIGSWDNSIVMYDLEYGRVVDSFTAHSDSVTCLIWSSGGLLISGGWDCIVRVWSSLSGFGKGTFRPLHGLKAELDHDSRISCLALNKIADTLLCGTEDGELILWNMESKSPFSNLVSHRAPVSGACFISEGKRIVTCSMDGELRVTDISINSEVFSKFMNEGLSCLCYDGYELLCIGGCAGTLFLWNLRTVVQITHIKAHNGLISSVTLGVGNTFIVTGGEDCCVNVWRTELDQ